MIPSTKCKCCVCHCRIRCRMVYIGWLWESDMTAIRRNPTGSRSRPRRLQRQFWDKRTQIHSINGDSIKEERKRFKLMLLSWWFGLVWFSLWKWKKMSLKDFPFFCLYLPSNPMYIPFHSITRLPFLRPIKERHTITIRNIAKLVSKWMNDLHSWLLYLLFPSSLDLGLWRWWWWPLPMASRDLNPHTTKQPKPSEGKGKEHPLTFPTHHIMSSIKVWSICRRGKGPSTGFGFGVVKDHHSSNHS